MKTANGRIQIPTDRDVAEACRDWEAQQYLETDLVRGGQGRHGEELIASAGLMRWVVGALVAMVVIGWCIAK